MKHFLIVLVLSASAFAQFQNAELTASDGQAGDEFGYSVSVSGPILAAAVPSQNFDGQGIIYLFQKSSTGWKDAIQLAKLTSSDGTALVSVSISGNVVVAGGPVAMVNGIQQGAAYVFVEPPGGWADATETARLTSSDGFFDDVFGISVAINGKTIVVGAPSAGFTGQGEAYVFTEPTSGWASGTETAQLTPSNFETMENFGSSVSVYGYRIAVGAPEANGHGGAVYVFQEPVGGWVSMTETAELTNTTGHKFGQHLGYSVAEHADTVVSGAYVYVEPSNGWANTGIPTAILTSTATKGEVFGTSVAINSQLIVIGDPGAQTGHRQYDGGAFAYKKPVGGWKSATETAKLLPTRSPGQAAGISVAAELNGKAFIGSPDTMVGQNRDQGVVFVMTVKK